MHFYLTLPCKSSLFQLIQWGGFQRWQSPFSLCLCRQVASHEETEAQAAAEFSQHGIQQLSALKGRLPPHDQEERLIPCLPGEAPDGG